MDIVLITNRDENFYPLMGPYLARRLVEKELGHPIYDDDDKKWFVAIENSKLIGFCYLQETKENKFQVGSCYVLEGHRNRGVFQKLLAAATDKAVGAIELTTNKEIVGNILISLGFSARSSRGSYTVYRKELDHE